MVKDALDLERVFVVAQRHDLDGDCVVKLFGLDRYVDVSSSVSRDVDVELELDVELDVAIDV